MAGIEILKSGLLTTVQDLGRTDYRMYGVNRCGAMDRFSLRLANLLVGNGENEAALEVTLIGPHLKFLVDGVIAVTGGDLAPRLNGTAIGMWKTILVSEGDILQFGHMKHGCRSYVAIKGGIDVPLIMGSRSTFIRGGYGGLEGRSLKEGDRLDIGEGEPRLDRALVTGRSLPAAYRPDFVTERPIRFIPGPQSDRFIETSLDTFVSDSYGILNESDRMGYRLKGPQLTHKSGADMISGAVTIGSIQVPGDGQPIILMSDCQVTGGYAQIGVVIGVDIPYLAQRKPGDRIQFQQIGIEDAQHFWREQERLISMIRLHNIC
jgi:antagonist of KipI